MKNKQGFTLAEVLMVLLIIGILTVFSILTLKRKEDEYGPLYYRAFEALKIANYNVFIDLYPKFPRHYPTVVNNNNTDENYKTGTEDQIREWLSGKYDINGNLVTPGHPGGICQRLLEYINVSEGQTNCGATLIDPNGGDSQFDGNLNAGGHLAFKGSNSQRFYFGKVPAPIKTGEKDKYNNDIELGWFIVYVDLNGERGPNSTTIKGDRAPDIVAFALTDQGQIAPIGLPRVERKFLTAKVGYPHTYCTAAYQTKYGCTGPGEERIEKRFSDTITYDEAVRRTWGCRIGIDLNCQAQFGTREISAEADTIDFTEKPGILNSIKLPYSSFAKSNATIDDDNTVQNKTPASAAGDGLPGDCVANDPLENPCKVLIEKYHR